MAIFHICMSLFGSTLLSFCRPQSKLDLPTLRQGSRERKNRLMILEKLMRIKIQVLPTDIVAQWVEHRCDKSRTWVQSLASVKFLFVPLRSFFLCYPGEALEGSISTGVSNKLNNVDSNNDIQI